MITLKDLSKELNLSVSTISKALNDSHEISELTKERVRKLAKASNYKPNRVAVSLKNSKTKTIGVIIPDILNHFFAKVLHGIENESAKLGYSIITCISNESYEKELNSLQVLANGSVDGFIMAISKETQKKKITAHFKDILNQDIPILMFDRVSNNIDCDKVVIDDFKAAYKATNHLLKEGRKKIVLVNNIDDLSVGKLRAKGCIKAIEEATNYPNKPIEIKVRSIKNLETRIHELFEVEKDIDGVICIDNVSGVIALNEAKKRGFKIPKDISIIGFSDDNILHFTTPKLSTVTQHSDNIGEASVQLLVKRIESKEKLEYTTKTIDFSLNLRKTTI
jgi:LacI family transcriptional regulator